MTPTYIFQRGEPISYGLRVKSGDPAGFTVEAKLKPVGAGEVDPPPPGVPAVATFSVAFVAATATAPAYWALTIEPAVSATLPAGRYIADEKLSFGGQPVRITNPVVIIIKNSVSG